METLKRNRHFCNKIWQSVRFLYRQLDALSPNAMGTKMTIEGDYVTHPTLIGSWILHKLQTMVVRVNTGMSNYDFHIAADSLYTFFYSQLCDVYLEAVKSKEGQAKAESILILSHCLDVSLRCLAPFMPFLSEELYQRLHFKLNETGIKAKRWTSVKAAEFPSEAEVQFFCYFPFLTLYTNNFDIQVAKWRDDVLDSNMNLALQAITEYRSMKKTTSQSKHEGTLKSVLTWNWLKIIF